MNGNRRSSATFSLPAIAGRMCLLAPCLLSSWALGATSDEYERLVKPVLRARCFACHGVLKQEANLRLDTAGAALAGGDSGAVVVPGDSHGSLLLERVSAADESERMPPEGEPLLAEQIDAIRRWIQDGAAHPADEQPEEDPASHWAFQPPRRLAPPNVARADSVDNPIDAFLLAKLEQHGLAPQQPADPRVLLRRLYLDLIGMPPTWQEQQAFLEDPSPQAYQQLVDRLLDSPQYGERWGRHFMDIWRFSDWWGLGAEVRNSQKHMWHWRDWIVESLNADKGYDQMIREMLAADELYPDDLDRLRATGYLARQYFKFNRTTWLDETVEHTGKAFLGLTMNCAKCHDHKYDPFSHREYYQMRAFFEPYQVRLEMVPGESNFEANSIPRVFDCNLEAPTHLHIRGDDRNPDTGEALPPAPPAFLQGSDFSIQQVALPAVAHLPGVRGFVRENLLRDAQAAADAALARIDDAEKQLAEVQSSAAQVAQATQADAQPATDAPRPLVVVDEDFAMERPGQWESLGGQWQYRDGRLRQLGDATAESRYRLQAPPPRDFEARLRFATLGGQTWKSVGIAFDAQDAAHEVLVYMSAVVGGSKLQVAFRNGSAAYEYPPAGSAPRDVQTNTEYELTLRVRGDLLNVLIDGQDVLAYRLPIERRTGSLQLLTYDAQAEFIGFQLGELPADAPLREPTHPDTPWTEHQATLALSVARQRAAAAEAAIEAIERRAQADQQQATAADSAAAMTARIAAVRAERVALAHRAEAEALQSRLDVSRAAEAERLEAEKKLEAANAALDKARQEVEQESEKYTPLPGAMKTLESNVESEESRAKPFPRFSTGRRTALAQWIASPDNPLTARVAVNHLWMRHMGRPLIPTVFDLGRKGERPTHPELLDWLAVELMENNWSLKHLHRLIVTSAAYRRSSSNLLANGPRPRQQPGQPSDDAIAASPPIADRENVGYWRMNPTRMEAQAVRDSLLYLAGTLDTRMGGPSIPVDDQTSRRRSLYFFHSNNEKQRFLEAFDDAKVQECYRRSESVVPQQALALENSGLAHQAATALDDRIRQQLGASMNDAAFIRAAFQWILAADPSGEEFSACLQAMQRFRERSEESPEGDPAGGPPGGPEIDRQARVLLVKALFNHNDFVTVR